ncbi:probable LRR receptor-like serine/threonine-protein kinase At1g07650 isoform X3 [Helianthus annuus]|uniref:probable LRR receptor-like serine/threonine-protein kinase At1g07650 isoform X3 n=1 Tax=Helianthus annuus TaxID=4232 RepID=UPI000B904811|nr:probable LRR receptor-like serine/threonine-protein kinase At1g07650 isoform X3 [Helianthus annuus]
MKKSLMLFLAYLAVTQSAKLDLQEVKVLQQIWEKLGLQQPKNLDRCSVNRGWVTCDCSFEGLTTSHVNNMDLSLNNLTVSILSEWATLSLSNPTLMGNRLSGPFPTTLTTMTTLRLLDKER